MKFLPAACILWSCLLPAAAGPDDLRLNQIQVIGSHNSYRLRPPEPVWKLLQSLPSTGAGDPRDLDYAHPPLGEQFDSGVRSIELDLYCDPEGGRFVRRAGMALAGQPAEAPEPELTELKRAGCKVLHLPDFDFASRSLSLRSALESVSEWSRKHPQHVPLIIHFETKDESIADKLKLPGLTTALPWDAAACDSLDAEIRAVLGAELPRVFTPDRLRGEHATLEKAALANAWPSLKELRGHVLFVMEGVAPDTYSRGHPSLRGRVAFIYGRPGQAETAFLLMNIADRQQEEIAGRVREGYMVRTRADSGTSEARTGNTSRRDAALASGAQIVSTDYPVPDARAGKDTGWTSYQVSLPEGAPARANPVTAADVKEVIQEGNRAEALKAR